MNQEINNDIQDSKEDSSFPIRNALYVSKSEKTFVNDEFLPSLPVPTLDHTLSIYLDSVKSVVTEEEFENTKRIVDEFQNGIGEKLHSLLLEKAQIERNWLEKWWEDIAYLSNRKPLLPLCNVGGLMNMDDIWLPLPGSQTERAGLYLYFCLQFWNLLRKEHLKPQFSQNIPLSMHQFRRYFNTTRIPGEKIDKLECYFKTEYEEESIPRNIIVLCGGHIFSFDAVDENGVILLPPELQLQLERIRKWCDENGPGPSVGSLTLADRTIWSKNRKRLLQVHLENEKYLKTIESALLVVALDDGEPVGMTELAQVLFSGESTNRWLDKSVSFIVHRNGTSGKIMEHAPYDGLVPVVVNHFVHASLQDYGPVWKGHQTIEKDLEFPKHLDFHLDDFIKRAIVDSKQVYQSMADDVDVVCECFTQYGKAFLKTFRCHPNIYAQLALHLAYYTMHKKPAPTYLTAPTRQFYHGRTETMRSCFPEVIQWVQAMVKSDVSSRKKLKLMQTAAEKFDVLMKDCINNKGCDRHLLGLHMICIENRISLPEIFTDPSFSKSGGNGSFKLSTSCTGFTPVSGFAMPMKEDGYGIIYNIEDNRFTFLISAFQSCPETSAMKLGQQIEQALINMQQLLVSAKM